VLIFRVVCVFYIFVDTVPGIFDVRSMSDRAVEQENIFTSLSNANEDIINKLMKYLTCKFFMIRFLFVK
jgi:hypothetical protein